MWVVHKRGCNDPYSTKTVRLNQPAGPGTFAVQSVHIGADASGLFTHIACDVALWSP